MVDEITQNAEEGTPEIDEVETPEQTEGETPPQDEETDNIEGNEDDSVVVTIGEDSPPQEDDEAPEWVKELRVKNREMKKKNRELEERLKAKEEAEKKPAELGAKPKLEDHDFDSEVYEEELSKWFEKKREHDLAEDKKKQEAKKQTEAWSSTLENYETAKSSLKVKDYEEAEEVVLEALSETQQGMILQGAEDAALVVYALGKNPKRAKELASIKDPVKFAFAVGKLETTLKVSSRKAPPPEKKVKGSAASVSGDKALEKLREAAEISGDMSKVIAYKKQMKKKG